MKRALSALVLSLGLFVGLVAAEEPSAAKWLTSYDEAARLARKENKVVLADFTGTDWCGWCIKLKQEVFDKPEFAAWAAKKAVLLEVDFPAKKPQSAELKKQNASLEQKYRIEGYPTILLLSPEGEELARLGYLPGGPGPWLKAADEALAKSKPTSRKAEGASRDEPKADRPPPMEEAPAKPAEPAKPAKPDHAWLTSFDEALALAKKEGKLVLADFTGTDWCISCLKLRKEVFSTPEFKEWAAKKAVLVEVDFPRKKPLDEKLKAANQALKEKYAVEAFPTILLLDADGKERARLGYVAGGPAEWLKAAEAALAGGK